MADSALTDTMGNALLPFEVEGQTFYLRQPSPEEYDDAMLLQQGKYKRLLQRPDIADMAGLPCSENERLLYQAMLTDTQRRFDELPADAPQFLRDDLQAELARYQNAALTRTLAEEQADNGASLARDRWLALRLLCDAHGHPLFDPKRKDLEAAWARFPVKVKDAARPIIWEALALVREAPFVPASEG